MMAFYKYLENRSDQSFRKEADDRRMAMRRQEQLENEERHKEYIYYDAATEQGCIYKLLCCPHFGKITSERIIYSAHNRPKLKCNLKSILGYIFSFWRKKVDQIDYDLVLDVGVEQSCSQFLTNTGTVIIHCSAREDVSVVQDEREKLTLAIESEDELQLKNSLKSSFNIEALQPLVKEAEELLVVMVHKRFEQCKKDGTEFKHIFAHKDQVNTSQTIYVHDVHGPFQVLDDISYKITKGKNPNNLDSATKKFRDAYLQSITAGDIRVGEENNIIKNFMNKNDEKV